MPVDACLGKFKLASSENFDEYMKALGVGLVMRKMANTSSPVQEIIEKDGQWTIKTSTTFKTTEITFKLGEEFEETTADGRKVKATITMDGDSKMVHQQKGEKDTTLIREFSGDEMKMTLTVDDITCIRTYKRCE